MTNEEMENIARAVAKSVVSELRGPSAGGTTAPAGTVGPADFTLGDEDASCFTCSGRFRCRPSFLIQAESA